MRGTWALGKFQAVSQAATLRRKLSLIRSLSLSMTARLTPSWTCAWLRLLPLSVVMVWLSTTLLIAWSMRWQRVS
jgi:hypothetical protein